VVALAGVRLGRSPYGLGNRIACPRSPRLSRLPGNLRSSSLAIREAAALMPNRGHALCHSRGRSAWLL
jgi:hypothetical protein